MIDVALILAGGKGSRLSPWPAPKALLPVRGISIIERLIRHVEPYVKQVIVCTGYRAEDVEAALYTRRPRPLFSNAGEEATMMARIIQSRDEFDFGRALVLYGDHLADVDIPGLVTRHESASSLLTFTACKYRLPFGTVHGTQIFNDEDVLVNIGFALVDTPAWKYAQPEDGVSEWINKVPGAVFFTHEGKSTSINNHAEHLVAEEVWR